VVQRKSDISPPRTTIVAIEATIPSALKAVSSNLYVRGYSRSHIWLSEYCEIATSKPHCSFFSTPGRCQHLLRIARPQAAATVPTTHQRFLSSQHSLQHRTTTQYPQSCQTSSQPNFRAPNLPSESNATMELVSRPVQRRPLHQIRYCRSIPRSRKLRHVCRRYPVRIPPV
jgi:hypothetical protein